MIELHIAVTRLRLCIVNSENRTQLVDAKHLPTFTRASDNETLFIAYERACKDFGIFKEKHVKYICSQTTGVLKEIHTDVAGSEYKNYPLFKNQVDIHFRLIEEETKRNFRALKKKSSIRSVRGILFETAFVATFASLRCLVF